MRLLFIFPFCSPAVNSIAGGPIYLGEHGHQVLVITSRHADSLKGSVDAEEHEVISGAEFYRPFAHSRDLIRRPFGCWSLVRQRVEEFRPDAIVCFGEFNYRLPERISREFGVPMFLYMEYLRPSKIAFPMRGRSYLRRIFPGLHDYLARQFLANLAKKVKAIMYAYYGDQVYENDVRALGVPVEYVPWCAEVNESQDVVERQGKVGIYIGSLAAFKNAAELVKAIPLILDHTATERFIVVGPGEYADQIKELVSKYGERLQYISSVPRTEAIRLIKSATYGYTPVTDCGLGFIGDCWGNGTPLIATHTLDGFLKPEIDTLVARNYQDLAQLINKLLSSPEYQKHMAKSGRMRFEEDYTAKAAGERYIAIIRRSISQ